MADYLAAGSGTDDEQIATGRLHLRGLSCREAAGSAAQAEFVLRDGVDATGPVIVNMILAADEAVNLTYGGKPADNPGILCRTGIFLERISGTCDVTIYT